MVISNLSLAVLPLASALPSSSTLDTLVVPVLFDILTLSLFVLGVAALFWRRSKPLPGSTTSMRAPSNGGRGISTLASVTLILPVACLLLVWANIPAPLANPSPPPTAVPRLKASPTPALDLVTPHTLTIGSSFNVLGQTYVDNNGKQTGFDVAFANDLAQNMKLQPQFADGTIDLSTDKLIDGLQQRKYDVVVSALRISPELRAKADFVPYLSVGESLLVLAGNPKGLSLTKDVTDLCRALPGIRVGVRMNSSALIDLENGQARCRPGTAFQIKKEDTTLLAVQALSDSGANGVDAVFQDSTTTDYYLSFQNGDKALTRAGQVINPIQEGIAVRKGDTQLLRAVQNAYEQLKQSNMYDTLMKNWGFDSGERLT